MKTKKKRWTAVFLAAVMMVCCLCGCSSTGSTTSEATAATAESTLPDNVTLTEDGTLGDLLVVVDMQNVYLEDQPWACTNTTEISQKIQSLIEQNVCDNVVFTRYIAPENPVGTWVTYNEVNAEINSNEWYNEVVDNLLPYTQEYPTYDKSTYSSYGSQEFKDLCLQADRIIVTGVMAECCVLATVIDGIDTGTPVVYLSDAVAGSSEEYEQEAEDIVAFASPTHTTVMTTDEYIASRN